MMVLTAADIRRFANLPDKVADTVIEPHLERGLRFCEKRAGRPIDDGEGDKDWREAAMCMTMYFLLPIINTMYLDGASSFARESDDITDYVFCSPSQVVTIQNYWKNRAEGIIADLETAEGEGNVMVEVI